MANITITAVKGGIAVRTTSSNKSSVGSFSYELKGTAIVITTNDSRVEFVPSASNTVSVNGGSDILDAGTLVTTLNGIYLV